MGARSCWKPRGFHAEHCTVEVCMLLFSTSPPPPLPRLPPALHFMPLPSPSKSGLRADMGTLQVPTEGHPFMLWDSMSASVQWDQRTASSPAAQVRKAALDGRASSLERASALGMVRPGLSSALCFLAVVWRVAPSQPSSLTDV